MPYFECEFDKGFLDQLNHLENTDEVCEKMLSGAIPILVSSIKRSLRGVMKHPTGELEESIIAFDPWHSEDGFWKASAVATGKTKKKQRISGKVYARSKHGTMSGGRALFNDDKLWMLEQGTSRQPPRPILRTATLNAENEVLEKMQEIFTEEAIHGR